MLQLRICTLFLSVWFLTYDGGEASRGLIPRDQLVQVRVVKLQTLQEHHVASLSFSVEDVQ